MNLNPPIDSYLGLCLELKDGRGSIDIIGHFEGEYIKIAVTGTGTSNTGFARIPREQYGEFLKIANEIGQRMDINQMEGQL